MPSSTAPLSPEAAARLDEAIRREPGRYNRDIARECGVSLQTVSHHRARLGLEAGRRGGRPRISAEVRERALRAMRGGASYAEVGRRLGLCPATVWRITQRAREREAARAAARAARAAAATEATPEDIRPATTLYYHGESPSAIARRLGVTHASLVRGMLAAGVVLGRDAHAATEGGDVAAALRLPRRLELRTHRPARTSEQRWRMERARRAAVDAGTDLGLPMPGALPCPTFGRP